MKKILFVLPFLILPLVGCGSSAPQGTADLKYKLYNNNGVYTATVGDNKSYYATDVKIPNEIEYNGNIYKVTGVSADAFKNNKSIKNVIVGDNVTFIGWDAFLECSSLQSVHLGKSLKTLGDHVFSYSENLNSVTGGEALQTMYKGVFQGTSVKSFNFPALAQFDIDCFWNNRKLEDVSLTGPLKYIPGSAFERCPSLKKVTISDTVTSIGNYSFKDCSSLESFDFSHITSTGISSFENTNFKEVRLENVYVGHSSFNKCRNLEKAYFKGTTIPYKLFGDCKKLTDLTIEDVEVIGSNAFVNDPIKSIVIPSSVKEIYSQAFENTKLTSLTFEAGSKLELIHRRAFYNNCLTGELNIPESVKHIYTLSFGRNKLNSININKNTVLDDNVFDNSVEIKYY